jgi:hypothetical protein
MGLGLPTLEVTHYVRVRFRGSRGRDADPSGGRAQRVRALLPSSPKRIARVHNGVPPNERTDKVLASNTPRAIANFFLRRTNIPVPRRNPDPE